jgi:hypothetical protein
VSYNVSADSLFIFGYILGLINNWNIKAYQALATAKCLNKTYLGVSPSISAHSLISQSLDNKTFHSLFFAAITKVIE